MRAKRARKHRATLAWNDPMIIESQRRRVLGDELCKEIAFDMNVSIEIISRYTKHLSPRKSRKPLDKSAGK